MFNVTGNENFITSAREVCNDIIFASYAIVPMLLVLLLISQLFKGMLYNKSLYVDYSPVVRGFIIMFILAFYVDIMDVLSKGIGGFCSMLGQVDNIYLSLDMLIDATGSDKEGLEGFLDQLKSIWEIDFSQMITAWLQGGVLFVVRKVVTFIRMALVGFLYCAGPLALALSVIPGFSGLAVKWFQNYLAVQLWSVTIIILDNIVATIANNNFATTTGQTLPWFGELHANTNFLVISIVIILLYMMVPFLTSFFIGSTTSGAFQARLLATAAIGTRVLAGGAAASAAASRGAVTAGRNIGTTVRNNFQTVRYNYDSFRERKPRT